MALNSDKNLGILNVLFYKENNKKLLIPKICFDFYENISLAQISELKFNWRSKLLLNMSDNIKIMYMSLILPETKKKFNCVQISSSFISLDIS